MSTVSPETAPSDPVISLENLLLDYPEGAVILHQENYTHFLEDLNDFKKYEKA
jgi:hypothetical protein